MMPKALRIVLLSVIVLCAHSQNAATNWTGVQNAIYDGINSGLFSGCVLGVATETSILLKKAFGTVTPVRGLYAAPVTVDMKFDIGSLTQVLGIGSGIMQSQDDNKLNVTDRVTRYLFDFDNNGKRFLTLGNMMLHNSGLQADWNTTYPKAPVDLLKAVDNLKLDYKTQADTVYSQLGYVVLGQMYSKLKNTTLDHALYEPLLDSGLRDTSFNPLATTPAYKIVPGGYHEGGVIWGTARNKLSNFLGSIAGNSGLFSTVDNVVHYMQLMLGRGKTPTTNRVFQNTTIDFFTTPPAEKYNNTRAYGWDTVPKTNPPCGRKFSKNSFGLADASGTYAWADKDKNVTIVLLANGGFPLERRDPSVFQGKLSDAVMTALGY